MRYSVEESEKRRKIKNDAKAMLFRHPLQCLGVALTVGVLWLAFAYLEGLALTVSADISVLRRFALLYGVVFFEILFLAPALIGAFEFFLNMVKDRPARAGDVFSWYGEARRVLKAVAVYFVYYLVFNLWIAVFMLPAGAAVHLLSGLPGAGPDSSLYIFPVAALMLFGLSRALTYTGAFYLLAEDPSRKALFCVRRSAGVLKPLRWELVRFVFSFAVWFVLCFISSGAFLLFVIPYFLMSLNLFFEEAFAKKPEAGQSPPERGEGQKDPPAGEEGPGGDD